MPLSLKLPRRNPDAPRQTLRERAATLKASAARVIGKKPDRFTSPTPPKPVGAGEPSKALAALIQAHELAYGHVLCSQAYGLPDVAERRQAEENAFRALLHTPLHSDADRVAYAVAVISRQMGALGDGSAAGRDHPLPVAYRNLRFGEHAREQVQETAPELPPAMEAPSARFDAYDHKTGLVTYADAAGTVRAQPAAEWIAFMAMRLHHVARSERSRQFNAVCSDLNGDACAELEERLTRELRIDAIHALALCSERVFAEAQAERLGHTGAGASAAKVDLQPLTVQQLVNLHEAYRTAQHLWDGVGARPYSIASRDPRGCIHLTMAGHLADFEENRAAFVADRIVDELASRSPRNETERDYILTLRLQREIDCEGRIRDADMMREIAQAWGA